MQLKNVIRYDWVGINRFYFVLYKCMSLMWNSLLGLGWLLFVPMDVALVVSVLIISCIDF